MLRNTRQSLGFLDARFAPLGHTHEYLPLAGGTLTGNLTLGNGGQLVIGPDGTSTVQNALRLNSGVAGGYLAIYANTDGGCGFTSTSAGTFQFNMGWRIDFRTPEDVCLTASRYVDFKDRDAADAMRVRVDTATGIMDLSTGDLRLNNVTRITNAGAATFVTAAVGGAKDWGKLASAPTSPDESDTYYDAATHKRYTYDGTTWQAHW